MTQAHSVLSTTTTNTSALPLDTTTTALTDYRGRRRCLSPPRGKADASKIGPIYGAIGKHQQALAAHKEISDVRAAFDDINMNDEQAAQQIKTAALRNR